MLLPNFIASLGGGLRWEEMRSYNCFPWPSKAFHIAPFPDARTYHRRNPLFCARGLPSYHTVWMCVRDAVGTVYRDEDLPTSTQPTGG